MKAKLRKFKEEDAYAMELHKCFLSDPNIRERTVATFRSGVPILTICMPESDAPLAVVGGHKIFSRVAECWSLVDQAIEKHPFYYSKAMHRVVSLGFDFYELDRMQIAIRVDQLWAQKWAKWLGFELEGEMKSYGEALVSHYLFAKVRAHGG